jgi:signal transduction histidine kinase
MRLRQNELERHPAFRGFGGLGGAHPPLRGWLAAPLVGRDGANLGVIQVTHKEEGEFTSQDEAVLVQVAQMAAAVIEDRLLRSQLEERVRELDASLAELRRMHEERRRLLGQLVATQEEERARLARELHDDPVQIMTAVSMRLEIVWGHLRTDELAAFERLQQTVAEAIARLRRMMFELRPLALDDGLTSALNHYLYQHDLLDRGSVQSAFTTEPPPETRTILYRIAQEALTSIRKHGNGSRFEVVLSERGAGHMLEVREHGDTFDAVDEDPAGVGIASMRERAELAGGWFSVDGAPAGGTILRGWIPQNAAARILP